MNNGKSSYALFIGNRGFFPASLLAGARKEMTEVLEGLGHKVLMLDAGATRHGAVETSRKARSMPISCVKTQGSMTASSCAFRTSVTKRERLRRSRKPMCRS